MKILSGCETGELPQKVLLLYRAVGELIAEGVDVNTLKILDITQKAGIGKGTAYDYFDSKEEVIVCGILFSLNRLLREVVDFVSQNQGFKNRLEYLFVTLDRSLGERNCLLRFIQLLMGSSTVSVCLRNAMEQEAGGETQPLRILDRIVKEGMQNKEINSTFPVSYVVYTICARFLTYAVLMDIKGEERPLYAESVDMKQMRQLLLNGILQEFAV